MTVKFNVPGKRRKELAQAIATWLGCESIYKGAPTFAYEVDYFTIDREGTLFFDDRADSEEVENLFDHLNNEGFEFESPKESIGICIKVPITDIPQTAFENLLKLIESKRELIQKAIGCSCLTVNITDDNMLEFPWFTRESTSEEIKSYMIFVTKLIETAKSQKRVTAKPKSVENEKFAFRCFLFKLGFIGDEYKTARKILLKNFEGSSAFKSAPLKKYRVELDDDNFKVFSAKDESEAWQIAWEIAEESGSEFCDVCEEKEDGEWTA